MDELNEQQRERLLKECRKAVEARERKEKKTGRPVLMNEDNTYWVADWAVLALLDALAKK